MKIVIDIDHKTYDRIKRIDKIHGIAPLNDYEIAIANGTSLPKQHGKIIDADSIPSYRIRGVTEYCRGYNDRTAEVENAIVNATPILK